MMVLIYACMLITLLLAWYRHNYLATSFFVLTLSLAIAWFLFHVYSPEYGFRMPWIQTHHTTDDNKESL